MLYLSPPSTPPVRDAMRRGLIGAMTTPKQGNRIEPGWPYGADNGCFGNGYIGDGPWIEWLDNRPHKEECLFAVAPDVVCDAKATLKRSAPFLPVIREMGYPAAFVIQNGITRHLVPWDDCDVIFIGGDDEFKGGKAARAIVDEARSAGKRIHMGRVNTFRRLKMAAAMGCDTADGLTLALYPQTLKPMLRWLQDNRVQQEVLW